MCGVRVRKTNIMPAKRNEIRDYGLCDEKKKVTELFGRKPVLRCTAKETTPEVYFYVQHACVKKGGILEPGIID